ncbi:hypothetical protein F4Y93_01225 [Candidatus Poribacteria bacterium]|nr:hypothetical protein [Candidatus Poribacteria bacterium]
MKNLTLTLLATASIIAILSAMLTSCNTGVEAQDVLNPTTLTADDLSMILEGMPLADVKTAISQINPEVRGSIGVHALNSLPDNKTAFDTGKSLEGEVRDGAASALLDELINECLTEIPIFASGNLTDEQTEEFLNTHCFTNMRRKFKDLNEVYSVIVEEVLANQYTLPPLD